MRKYIKNKITEILSTIVEANNILTDMIINDDTDNSNILLTDIQSTIIEIGNEIEKSEKDCQQLIGNMEEFCELLYKCSIATMKKDRLHLCHAITENFNIIREQIQALPVVYDLVFLPYKASMWDSFESIWLAAKDNPNCNCHVMPIPYYDKKPDGSFGEIHYEGDLFPDYVPITDYRKYDLEQNHPDVIFIHNPYDQYNYATSVHPDFYSRELKKHTDLLVYIPYFVCEENTKEELLVNMGVLTADKVIVESEKVKEQYIGAFINSILENQKINVNNKIASNSEYINNIRKMAESKFVALGSPKYDKVISSKKEDFTIPKEWADLIGSRKVVLYNTSISAFLNNKDRYLKKIRSVFEHFKNRKDVVLWWRPHPLMKATVDAMAPELSREYVSVVSEYRKENFGIYDDTADLHRAIAYSDAYYGDGGSLLAMYRVTGKPVMLQNINII
jgi:hypothetical protein